MALLRGVENDNNDQYDVTLTGAGDITGATVQARMKLVGSNPPVLHQEGVALVDAVNGKVRLTLTTGALPHGLWSVDWVVTYQDTSVLTWPEDEHDYVKLRRKN